MDSAQETFNAERRELVEKIEGMTLRITSSERTLTTLENQKDALTANLASKDKQIEDSRAEFLAEKTELISKSDDLKKRFESKEDELTQKKIDFEREQALQKQQIVFTEQKASDLQNQLDKTV